MRREKMQLFIGLGKPWHLSVKPFCKILFATFPVELMSLFTFIFVAEQFINQSSFAIPIFVIWILFIYLIYLIRSQCNGKQNFNSKLNLDVDEIVDLFHQLPNFYLFRDRFFLNSQSSTEWINCLLSIMWPRCSDYFNKKIKKFTFPLIKFFTLENFSIGYNSPLVESLNSNLISHNHEDTLLLNFNLYWLAKSAKLSSSFSSSASSSSSLSNENEPLVYLKFLHHSLGSLTSFCIKVNCQIRIRFIQLQMNEDIQLRDIQFSFTHSPAFHHLQSTGLIWMLDNLQLVRPILSVYLNERFLFPKSAIFKFRSFTTSTGQISRRPQIGCPAALFCIDVIQAENIPMIKNVSQKGSEQVINANAQEQLQKLKTKQNTNKKTGLNANEKSKKKKSVSPNNEMQGQQSQEGGEDMMREESKSTASKRCPLFRCFSYRLPSVFCSVRIFNQQFTSPHIANSANPFWNFRSFIPIFSHNRHLIDQLEKYHSLSKQDTNYDDNAEGNPIDLNASFYQFHQLSNDQKVNSFKQFISYDLLEKLSVHIQLFDKRDKQTSKLIAEFQITDPSQYFLDTECNGQSMWICSSSSGVTANADQAIKLNVRFTFLTLNQTLNSSILSNAYLANRLAFPIGVMLVFVDSLIGLNVDLLRSNLNPERSTEYGFQIICQLGNQVLYTSICKDQSLIWENELLFCVYSLNLEKMSIKLVTRTINTNNFELTTIATSKLDLSGLIYQPTLTLEQYIPLVLKSNPSVQLKILLIFRIINFTAKLTMNYLRNAKVTEEDALVRERQVYIEEKLKTGVHAKQLSFNDEESISSIATTCTNVPLKDKNLKEKQNFVEDTDIIENQLDQFDERDSNEEQSNRSGEPASERTLKYKTSERSNILVSVRMRWPKMSKFVIEIVELKCGKFLALFQMYSIDVYLNCVIREKEKALQSRRTKNFQLKTSNTIINQELKFNCISKPLSAYHLNISLHEKRTEEYSKVAELYAPLPSLILASGQIEKQFILRLTPMYLKTSGLQEAAINAEYEFDVIDAVKTEYDQDAIDRPMKLTKF